MGKNGFVNPSSRFKPETKYHICEESRANWVKKLNIEQWYRASLQLDTKIKLVANITSVMDLYNVIENGCRLKRGQRIAKVIVNYAASILTAPALRKDENSEFIREHV